MGRQSGLNDCCKNDSEPWDVQVDLPEPFLGHLDRGAPQAPLDLSSISRYKGPSTAHRICLHGHGTVWMHLAPRSWPPTCVSTHSYMEVVQGGGSVPAT